MASEDSFVYLYNCGDYIAKAKCGGFSGPVRLVLVLASSVHPEHAS